MPNDGRGTFLSSAEAEHLAILLAGQDKEIRKTNLSLSRFKDDDLAIAFSRAIAHYTKYSCLNKLMEIELIVSALPAVGEARANLFADVLTGIRSIVNAETEKSKTQAEEPAHKR